MGLKTAKRINFEAKLVNDMHKEINEFGFAWCLNMEATEIMMQERDDIEVSEPNSAGVYLIKLKEEKE